MMSFLKGSATRLNCYEDHPFVNVELTTKVGLLRIILMNRCVKELVGWLKRLLESQMKERKKETVTLLKMLTDDPADTLT